MKNQKTLEEKINKNYIKSSIFQENTTNTQKRLEKDMKNLNTDLLVLSSQMGIKHKTNGERDQQLRNLQKQQDEMEDTDKTLYQLTQKTQLDLSEIKGYWKARETEKKYDKQRYITFITIAVGLVIELFLLIIK